MLEIFLNDAYYNGHDIRILNKCNQLMSEDWEGLRLILRFIYFGAMIFSILLPFGPHSLIPATGGIRCR
jgi:hypothetical protein